MASVYKKGSKIYISWFDWSTNKTKNKSTQLEYNSKNMRTAKVFSEKLQKELDEKKKEYSKNALVKRSSINSAFERFLSNNATKNKKTIDDYQRFYRLFIQTYNENDPCAVINKMNIEEWINKLKKLKFARNTIHGYFKQCNHFLNFLFEYNYIPAFKINHEVKTKAEVKEIITFSDEDLVRIFQGLKDKNSNFKTMVYLAYYTGLRSSDILTITVDRVNLEQRTLSYYSPKTKKYFIVKFHNDLIPILKERITKVKTGNLLSYIDHTNMAQAFRRYLTELGLNNLGYSMRTFRKTFITNASQTMDLASVAKLVGHSQITTTAKYYTKVDLERQEKEIDKFKGLESAD